MFIFSPSAVSKSYHKREKKKINLLHFMSVFPSVISHDNLGLCGPMVDILIEDDFLFIFFYYPSFKSLLLTRLLAEGNLLQR